MSDLEKIEAYIEAAGESSKRSRSIVVLIVIASILTLITWYNSQSWSWRSRRDNVVRDAVGWWPLCDRTLSKELKMVARRIGASPVGLWGSPAERRTCANGLRNYANKIAYRTNDVSSSSNELRTLIAGIYKPGPIRKWPDRTIATAESDDRRRLSEDARELINRFNRARSYVAVYASHPSCTIENLAHNKVSSKHLNFVKTRLEDRLRKLSESRIEHGTFINISALGVAVDINDLGLFSGITFLVLLTWMHFSIGRELENLDYVFGACGNEQSALCYELLAMRQVLTIPPRYFPEKPDAGKTGGVVRNFWRYFAPNIFLLLPAAVQCVIAFNQYQSISIGSTISTANANREAVFSAIFCGLVLWATIACLRQRIRVDQKWRHYRNALPNGKNAV